MNKIKLKYIILLLVILLLTTYFFSTKGTNRNIISISLVILLYLIYVLFFKTFPKNYYLINFVTAIAILLNYKNLFTKFEKFDFYMMTLSFLQVIFLLYFSKIWQKHRETLTFEISSNKMRNVVEKQFHVDSKFEKIEDENIKLETKKNMINKIYSQIKLINSTLDLDKMIDLTEVILKSVINLPNFVLWLKDPDKNVFNAPIKFHTDKCMPDYIEYLNKRRNGEFIQNVSVHIRIDINNEVKFINQYGECNFKYVNLYPLNIKDEQVGLLIFFECIDEKNRQYDEYIKIVAPQIAMGIKKSQLYKKVSTLSQQDGLTKLFLHRVFEERLEYEFIRIKRYNEKVSLIMFDIDHFKKFNDNYGHLVGDKVLQIVADIIASNISEPFMAARYGGEEFAVICPNYTKIETALLAEKIRQDIENYRLNVEGKFIGVTISGGVAESNMSMKSKDVLIKKADKALYKAKETGRNKIITD